MCSLLVSHFFLVAYLDIAAQLSYSLLRSLFCPVLPKCFESCTWALDLIIRLSPGMLNLSDPMILMWIRDYLPFPCKFTSVHLLFSSPGHHLSRFCQHTEVSFSFLYKSRQSHCLSFNMWSRMSRLFRTFL